MNLLDMRTVIFSYVISNFICLSVIAVLWYHNRRQFAGLGFWLAGYSMQWGAVLLVILRGRVPDFLSMTVSNSLVIGGTLLLFIGLEQFVGKRGRQIHNYVMLGAFVIVHAYFVYYSPNLTARNILFSLGILVMCSQAVWLLLRRIDREMASITGETWLIFALYCLVSVIRIGIDLITPPQSDFFQSNFYDTVVILTYQMLFILLTFGLFLMVNRRLVGNLSQDIAVRKQVEGALRESEEKFFKAFHASPDAILITRLSDGKLVEVNDGFCRISEYPREEALASSSLALSLWANPQERDKMVAELQGNQRVQGYELDFRTRSGKILQCLYSGEIINLGDEAHVLSVVRDITEPKQMEKTLRESELKHRTILQTAMDGFWEVDGQAHIIQVNDAYCRMSGYSDQELLSMRISDLEVVETPEMTAGHIQKIIAQGQDRFETRHRRKDGSLFDIEVSVQYREGRFIAFVRDITVRKKMETALRENQELFSQFLKYSPIYTFIKEVTPTESRVLVASENYQDMVGIPGSKMAGMNMQELFPAEFAAKITADDWDVVTKGEILRLDEDLNDRHYTTIKFPIILGDKTYLAGYTIDITERKQTEEIMHIRLRLWDYSTTHSIGELLQQALDEICILTNSPIGFYHFVEEDQINLSLQAWSTRTLAEFCRAEGRGLHYPINEAGVWVDCVAERKPVIHNDYASLPHRKGLPEGHAEVIRELVVPILRNDRVVAILGVGNKPADYDENDAELVEYIADVIWSIVEQKRADEQIRQLNSKLEWMAMTDDLTGVGNRRSFFKRGEEEIKRSQRYQTPFSLLMLDIDDFKRVNDTFGHDFGDFVLHSIAQTLASNIREIDFLARIGGEEFGILLPNTEMERAATLGERLRSAVEESAYTEQDRSMSVTVSIGVTTYSQDILNFDTLLIIADQAMYQAKDHGKNRVIYLE